MGHLIRRKSLAVNEILNRVHSEKTYFVYTEKGVRIIKIAAFLLFAFIIGNQFYISDADVIRVQPVAKVTGATVFGEPSTDVDIIDLAAVRPYMKKKTTSDLKIKGLVSSVDAKGQLEMRLEDGTFLKVNHQMKLEDAKKLLTKEVVMSGMIFKNRENSALTYEANSLTVL